MKGFAALFALIATGSLGVALFGAFGMSPRPAEASGKYTQQTGKACSFCHTTIPALNEQGRRFKEQGYKL